MQKNLIDYENTYFDKEPFLDVCNPPLDYMNYADILISSDVLEHVMFPFEKAILGSFDILKPGGWLLLTTPYFKGASFVENYPWMKSYLVSEDGVVTGNDGIDETVIVDPIFHGGPGNTLEMRIFSPEILNLSLKQVGFENIKFLEEDINEFGILRSVSKMGTIIARKPKKRFMGLRTNKLLEF
jgi:SAM-dependent methyltransferase